MTVTAASFLLKFWEAVIYSFQSSSPALFSWTYNMHKIDISSLLYPIKTQPSFYIVICRYCSDSTLNRGITNTVSRWEVQQKKIKRHTPDR